MTLLNNRTPTQSDFQIVSQQSQSRQNQYENLQDQSNFIAQKDKNLTEQRQSQGAGVFFGGGSSQQPPQKNRAAVLMSALDRSKKITLLLKNQILIFRENEIDQVETKNTSNERGRNGDHKPFKTEIEIPKKYLHQRLAPSITKLNMMISSQKNPQHHLSKPLIKTLDQFDKDENTYSLMHKFSSRSQLCKKNNEQQFDEGNRESLHNLSEYQIQKQINGK